MRRITRRGLSLLELLLALTILLLVSLYTMSMFSTGQSHFVRAQQFSQGNFLVNAKLQELLAVPYAELVPSTGKFPAPYDDFRYTVTLEPFELDMSVISVEVTSRRGAVARASTLVSDDAGFAGLAVDPATDRQVSAQGDHLNTQQDTPTTTSTAGTPGNCLVGGVAGMPGWNLLWISSPKLGLLSHTEVDGWKPAVPLPTSPPLAPLFTGLAMTQFGSKLFVGDSNNRGLWIYDDSGTPAWTPNQIVRATDPPLGSVGGVATDPYGSMVWVADRENQCLRKLLVGSSRTDSAVEPDASGAGAWVKKRYCPPGTIGMGTPHGVTMDPNGWAVYVVDRGRAYRFVDDPAGDGEWKVLCNFPSALVTARPSGLALDPYDNILYIATMKSGLWRLKLNSTVAEKI